MGDIKYSLQQFEDFKHKIFPIVKLLLPTEAESDNLTILDFTKENEPINIQVIADLLLFFGIDREDNYELLLRSNLEPSIDNSTLYNIAVENLNNFLDGKIQVANSNFGGKIIICGYEFEAASFLLFDWLRQEILEMLNDNAVVAIPSKDLVLITKESDKETIEIMKREVDNFYNEGGKLLSNKLFHLSKSGLTVY